MANNRPSGLLTPDAYAALLAITPATARSEALAAALAVYVAQPRGRQPSDLPSRETPPAERQRRSRANRRGEQP